MTDTPNDEVVQPDVAPVAPPPPPGDPRPDRPEQPTADDATIAAPVDLPARPRRDRR